MLRAILAALPWVIAPLIFVLRVLRSRSLGEYPAQLSDPPLVSVVIPARDEARNISRCLRSILASTYPRLEVIVVDDHSADGTGDIARVAAGDDRRVRVLHAPSLPDEWFGKQWACATGARAASGDLLCFTDADTAHGPDLLLRSVRAMRDRGAHLLSVSGEQEMGSFWERLVQPQIFSILMFRYGGTESVSRARRAENVIANGQYILISREVYDAVGGHEAVRNKVAEDLALAQRSLRMGFRVHMLFGLEHLSTRMYTSLGELVRGWMKNAYAGAIDSVLGGRLGRKLLPLLLPLPLLFVLAPPLMLGAAALGWVGEGVRLWALITTSAMLLWFAMMYSAARRPWYAAIYPLGSLVLLYIFIRAITRGANVEWKGRSYRAT